MLILVAGRAEDARALQQGRFSGERSQSAKWLIVGLVLARSTGEPMEIKPPSPARSPSSRIPPAIGKAPVGLAWGTLPGRTRPGLIEAREPGRTSTASSWPLPGRTRPGLIEALVPLRSVRPRQSLPGRTRPGLIEAALRDNVLNQQLHPSSGAYAPRPH